jgi:site-specific recombinase XerD
MKASAEAGGLVGPYLQAFFAEHLLTHKRASPQTIACYRDTFRLLLRFMRERTGTEPVALPLAALDADAVLAFLDHLERDRGCSVRSRNNRLAAIRSFFRVVALRVPDRLEQVTRVMAIPIKRGDKRLIHYLTRDEVKALLAAPDQTVWTGRRDHVLLLTLYNTGGRVSEIITLRREQVRLDLATGAHVELLGKGRKERVVPLWDDTARVLRAWFRELGDFGGGVAFPGARGQALSRDGVDHLLRRTVATAAAVCPSLGAKKISPHVLRHSTAMHLFQAGVDMAVIALWLGHESLETTHVYVEADLATKERALEKLAPMPGMPARYHPDDDLLAFLAAL